MVKNMKIQIKRELLDKVLDKLMQALSGKLELSDGIYIELFGEFNFNVKKENNKIVITFTGIKPRITAEKGWGFFSAEFQGRLFKIVFDSDGGIIIVDGLPDQTFEFI